MTSQDAIALSLTLPMSWDVFEDLVYNLLLADDLPSLRKLGGGNDWGLDAESVLYTTDGGSSRIVVQVTSQHQQTSKLVDTITKLRDKGVIFDLLVMVYRDHISSTVRREILSRASSMGAQVDPRDASYLIGQLSKHAEIYRRFFSPLRSQIDSLLREDDPLSATKSPLSRALLATLGSYINKPKAILAKSTLFERTVLAAAVSLSPTANIRSIIKLATELMPEENIDAHGCPVKDD